MVRAAQRPGRGARRLGARHRREQLRAPVPADVVRRAQAALLVAGDQHRLPDDVDHGDPAGLAEPEVGPAADAEPLAEQHPVPLDGERRGVDVQLPRQRGLQTARTRGHSAPPARVRAATRWQAH